MNIKLNSFHLKLVATFFMIVDHIALAFLPLESAVYILMRMAGRIAAPLFMFCFAVGFKNTKSKEDYLIRLSVAAILTSIGNIIILNLLLHKSFVGPLSNNIFATFFLIGFAIFCIEQIQRTTHIWKRLVCAVLAIILFASAIIFADYGILAVVAICSFYFIKNKTLQTLCFVVGSVLFCILEKNFVQLFMILASLFLVYYDETKPKQKAKWFFYVFYPTHYWALMLIAQIIKGLK